jgi:hypothetical protein
MTPATFAAYIRKQTKTNSTTYSDADMLIDANIVKDELAKEIIKVNEDIFGMPSTRPLVAGQREYDLPADMLNQIKFVEAKINGTDWQVLHETDLGQYNQPTDEASITQFFNGKYCFDIFRGSLWLLTGETIIDVDSGLKLWALQWPADLTSLSGTADMSIAPSLITTAIPRALHEIWARKVIVNYKESKEKPIPLSEREARVDADMAIALNSLRGMNLDRNFEATTPQDDGQSY